MKYKKSKLVATAISSIFCLVVSGCAQQAVQLPVSLDVDAAKKQLIKGNNQINGSILYEPDKGHAFAYPDTMVSCEGREVTLMPYTDFAREWALKYYGVPVTNTAYRLANRGKAPNIIGSDQLFALTRKTQCDEKGQFRFSDVSDGEYFLIAKVRWLGKDEESYQFGFAPEDIDEEDGSVIKKFTVNGQGSIVLDGPWP
jgi:hypothetical protein